MTQYAVTHLPHVLAVSHAPATLVMPPSKPSSAPGHGSQSARHRRAVRRVRLGQVTKRRVVGAGRVLTRARASALVVGVVGVEIAAVQVRRHDERVRHDPANHHQRLRRFLPINQSSTQEIIYG